MEAWLSELEKAWNSEEQNNDSQETMNTLSQELDHILGEEFPSLFSENSSPKVDNVPTKLSRCPSTTQVSPLTCNIGVKRPMMMNVAPKDQKKSLLSENKQKENGKKRRKREPSQTYDHIMAERKRREFLTQKFIALSAIVPGLKKVDKTTILVGAINYLQQLQQKVKTLEEEVASKQNEETTMVVRRSQLVVDYDDDDDDDSACTDDESCGFHGVGGGGGGYKDNSLPHIEVKVSNKSLLLTIYCENHKGISSQIFSELDKHEIVALNTNTMPFGNSALNITIVAQTEKTDKKHVKNLVRAVIAVLRGH